ncbi:MAG: MFS transporter [Marinicaulis sp.]|nr:MFS transporter [Marinicaulis sp.]NNL90502.1 MFS transporter [Marinicaulis sp.]
MADSSDKLERQSNLFLLLYAAAWAGGVIAYVPFLTVLLPARVADIAGEAAVDWLALIAFVGAIAASLGNIGFGWLSDIARTRRSFVALGLLLSCLLLVFSGPVEQLSTLLIVIALWQLSLNMMLGPLGAWAGDCVPDNQKGQLGGLLSVAPAIGASVGMFVTFPGIAAGEARLWLVATIVVLFVLPILVVAKPGRFPRKMHSGAKDQLNNNIKRSISGAVPRMWFARLFIQIAEAALFAYVLLWFRSLSETVSDNYTATVLGFVLIAGIPLAMVAGRWADKNDRPIAPLTAGAAVVVVGLMLMALADNLTLALFGYIAFGVAGTIFLSLHTAQTLRVLPRPETRGRDLGIFNLTNTVPSLIMPWLAMAIVPIFGFSALFMLLAVLAALAFLILVTMPRKFVA